MEFKVKVEDQVLEDLLVTALEGGSNYWYFIDQEFLNKPQGEPLSTYIFKEVMNNGLEVRITDAEDNENFLGTLNKQGIIEGTQLYIDKQPESWANVLAENYDATDGDIWFQMVLLKEVVYG